MGEITGIPPGKELGEEVLQTRLPSPADSVFGDGRGDEEADRIEENQRDLDLLPEGHKPQNENGNFPESTQQTQIITDSTKGPGGPRKKENKEKPRRERTPGRPKPVPTRTIRKRLGQYRAKRAPSPKRTDWEKGTIDPLCC